MSSASPVRPGLGVLLVLLASLLWGTTGTAATFAPEVGPLAIGAVALGIGGLLQAVVAGRGLVRALPNLRARWGLVLFGGLGVFAYPLAFYSSMHTAGVTIGTVVSLGSAPVFAALLDWAIDRKRPSRRWLLAAALGLAGMAVLSLFGGHAAMGGTGQVGLGVGLGLVAGASYAGYAWAAHRLIGPGVDSRVAMGAVFGLGGLLLMPVLIATGGPLLSSWRTFGVGAYMALVPMFLGYVLFGRALRHVDATTATVLTLSEPVIAAGFAAVIVGERLAGGGIVGVCLIGASLVLFALPSGRAKP
ncbi:DMT family transporter [Leucobacter aridicollis]|uniref:DMT family transporter n=1 Tax=Leucobacter aridicollis TaxID=283878 RepID=UPI00216A20F5|nr:EamA family transporter [Leucobacter aridicollis]MCS3427340.1 DME family drug/metabolite transporter [Leucobacter aridicollis]